MPRNTLACTRSLTRSLAPATFPDTPATASLLNHNQVRRLGYEPLEATNGLEAVELYEREAAAAGPCAVAAILLDLQMPVMDGWQAAQHLRLRHPALPIVACTACCLSEVLPGPVEQSLEAFTLACGADRCLNKPCSLSQLSNTLQELAVPCPSKFQHQQQGRRGVACLSQ